MSANVFSGDRTKESVAYDLALAIASKDAAITTPNGLIERIAELLPECREVAEAKRKEEIPPSIGMLIR